MQGLAAIFLMNNVHFMITAIETSKELGGLGADWLDSNRDLVHYYPFAAE